MRVCIYGAGAIGGTIGARLAMAGHEVSLVARGAHLEAIRANGLTLVQGTLQDGKRDVVRVPASANAADLGPQDVVIIGLKSHTLAPAIAGLAPLLGKDTTILTAMNGVPWWFFNNWGGALAGSRIQACDPDGSLGAAIAPERVVGGVVFIAANVPQPGVVHWSSGARFIFGEPSHQPSARVASLAAAFSDTGIEAVPTDNIRLEIWMKLLGNLCFNPVSVLTGASTDLMLNDRHLWELFTRMMTEAIGVANALGLDITIKPEARMAQTRTLGAIKSSMLQDVEAGRPIELDSIVGSVVEIAERLGIATPFINSVYGAVRVRAAGLGLYPKR